MTDKLRIPQSSSAPEPFFEDGGLSLYCGDCVEMLPAIVPDSAAVALVIADPPYGMNLDVDNSGTGDAKRMPGRKWEKRVHGDDRPFDPSHLMRFPRLVIWGANHFASRLPESNGWIVWNKRGDGQPSGMHFGDCELAWTNVGQGIRMFSNVWHGAPRWRAEPSLHPTQKPVALMSWLIQNYTQPGDLIVDPYAGSGPVLRAAKDLGRRCIAFEIDPSYCAVIAERLGQGVFDFGEAA